jgi:hypothetical protein
MIAPRSSALTEWSYWREMDVSNAVLKRWGAAADGRHEAVASAPSTSPPRVVAGAAKKVLQKR